MSKGREDKHSVAAFVIPSILALIAVASVLLFLTNVTTMATKRAYQSLSSSAVEQTATLREILNGRFGILEALASSLANQETPPELADITARMDAIVRSSDFAHLAVAGPDGVVYTNDGQVGDFSQRHYMTEALAGRRSIQKLTDSQLYQKNRIVLAVPLYKDGRVAGAVLGSFPDIDLEQLLVSSAFGGDAYSLLCDSTGFVIVGAEQPTAQYGMANVLEVLSGDRVEYFDGTSLETLTEDLQEAQGGLTAYSIDGVKRYVVYQPTGINDWFIFNVVPAQVVDQSISVQRRLGVLCIGAVALCATLLLIIMAWREAHRIRELGQAQEQQLVYYRTDSVTGLLNTPGFISEVSGILSDLPADSFCAMLDFGILNFNQYNVSFGSPAGDAVLRGAAETLLSHCRIKQPCARLSGDRFACFIFDCADKQELLERVTVLDEKLHAPAGTHQLQMTYGLYIVDDRTLDAQTLCDRAVAARLELTGGERNIGIYDHSVHQKQIEDAQLVACMEDSLRRGEFTPYYQPKYDAQTQRIVGAEALVRWFRPDGTVIPPDRFICLFEQNGLITKLDLYMFERVCEKLAAMDEPVPVAVNFSRAHMYETAFPDKLMALAKKHGVAPQLLEIELTETAFIDRREALMQNMFRLRELGFLVAIDDFGSGYSSLNLLKDVRFDTVKLDKEFLADKSGTGRGRVVVESILTLARALQVHTVAEGVETAEQLAFLREHGCDTIQGFYFSRPVPEAEFDALLQARGGNRGVTKRNSAHFPAILSLRAVRNGGKNKHIKKREPLITQWFSFFGGEAGI